MDEWFIVVGVGELWFNGINAIKIESSAGCNSVVSFSDFCCCCLCGANGCCIVVVVTCGDGVPRGERGTAGNDGIGLLDASGAKDHDTSAAIVRNVKGRCSG